jgi:hypothetical protein
MEYLNSSQLVKLIEKRLHSLAPERLAHIACDLGIMAKPLENDEFSVWTDTKPYEAEAL